MNLKFFEKPDYNYLRNLLELCAKNNNIILTKNNYEWVIDKQIEEIEKKSFKSLTNIEFDTLSGVANSCVGDHDKNIIEEKYIKTKNAFKINNILRTKGIEGLNEEDYDVFYSLNNAIQSYETQEDYLVHRYVDNNYLKDTFNFIPSNDIIFNLQKIKEQIGKIKVEKGFMSCFMTDKHIIKRNIKLEIKIPKGTHAYITQNKEESEIILNYNTEYQIIDAKIEQNIIMIYICILKHENSFVDNIKKL